MRSWSVLLIGIVCAAAAAEDSLSPQERQQGFVSMFNGQDFSGWRFSEGSALPEKLPDNWRVEDGVIKLSGGGSPHLASQWDYEDFEMRFQWRGMREKYNSGFYIRSGRKIGANQINLAKGSEGNFLGKLEGAKGVPELQKPSLEWNEWRVLVEAEHVRFWCNDQLAWEATGLKPARGYVGLQAEGAPLEFRNLRIRELGYRPCEWKSLDGALSVYAASTTGSSPATWKDYVLRCEWQSAAGAKAEIALRGPEHRKTAVQIGEWPGGSGGIAVKPNLQLDNPPGQWNYLEIHLAGSKASVWLNGVLVAKEVAVADLPASGPITVHADGQMPKLQNLRIRPLE